MASSNSVGAISRVLLLAWLGVACKPDLVVGTWSCPVGERMDQPDGGGLVPVTGPVAVPWSTDFEHGLCDLNVAQGWCYSGDVSSYEIVDTIARSGTHSMAFTLQTDADDDQGDQARCVREGVLPPDAIYGAWYYIPETRGGIRNWNLLHFQGGEPGGAIPGIWDVSIEPDADSGKLKLYVLGKFPDSRLTQDDPATMVAVPIGSWFHLEFRWRRAADETGRVSVYQDGKLVLDRDNAVTDDTNFAQFYVGNLAFDLVPPESTLYVDDISIRATH